MELLASVEPNYSRTLHLTLSLYSFLLRKSRSRNPLYWEQLKNSSVEEQMDCDLVSKGESKTHQSSSRESKRDTNIEHKELAHSPIHHLVKCVNRRRSCVTISFKSFLLLTLLIFLSLSESVGGCGPGRGPGRRRAPRKLTPLVYKQHVPNFPENSLSAAGLAEGRISRGNTQRFRELVANYNSDIIFRDDEGNGSDRLMTQKLRDKLNTLSISVMNQWPGVRLRVIEGWDENNVHESNSLHYEGRAVDIQTSDKDSSKYGMLARLAVEAGFEWVYYESKNHIHCSVRSDAFQTGRPGGCFSANSTVETQRGRINISELQIGDSVRSLNAYGHPIFSPVLLFLDRNRTEEREFYKISTISTSLTLTPSHLLYIIKNKSDDIFNDSNVYASNAELLESASVIFAQRAEVGDYLLTLSPTSPMLKIERILAVESLFLSGVFAPLTDEGNLVVDNILSSCYALIESQSLAHLSFSPIRLVRNLVGSLSRLWRHLNLILTLSSEDEGKILKSISEHRGERRREDEGIFWYASALYSLTRRILPSSIIYDMS